MFACMECGKKFRTANAAHRASVNGCPKCGGVEIDIDVRERRNALVSRDTPTQPRVDPASRSVDGKE
jgi:predicted  nucleic acid-binding Zn-ribbon protein